MLRCKLLHIMTTDPTMANAAEKHENENQHAQNITNPHVPDTVTDTDNQQTSVPAEKVDAAIDVEPTTTFSDKQESTVTDLPDSAAHGENGTADSQDEEGEAADDKYAASADQILDAELQSLPVSEVLTRMEALVLKEDAGNRAKEFGQLRDAAQEKIAEEEESELKEQADARFRSINSIFKQKQEEFQKKFEAENEQHIADRRKIIDRLKELNTNAGPGVNLFKEIREIKNSWQTAGMVAKADFKILSNDYFFHLGQFYKMLDLNKEYLQQEFAHNLERRQQIIARAKELEQEPSVQKALNELQYLHKLWKEEAGPVADEHKETTWEEFREISHRIHERRGELMAEMEAEHQKNAAEKADIIEKIKAFNVTSERTHQEWQKAIREVDALREQFLKLGSAGKKLSTALWNDFKDVTKTFSTSKNEFYKNLKGSQAENLQKKKALIETAQANIESEDWETAVPLYKNLQEEWKKIGHVPRQVSDEIWTEFRAACNAFFERYREKNAVSGDSWKDNYQKKKNLLEELAGITAETENGGDKIKELKKTWNEIGKVPRDKMTINQEFNQQWREKAKLFGIQDNRYADRGPRENASAPTDPARRIRQKIGELENQIATLENNIGFFHNPSRENPLLKDTFQKIDDHRAQLESLRIELQHMLTNPQ